MTTQEKINIEERLRTIESHLLSIDRTHRRNRKTLRGVLFATGVITICIIAAWIIWLLTNS